MSERKAINKYYPPDYDPSKIPRKKKKKPLDPNVAPTIKIRMMAPYSMRCTRCNEYIAQRRSFNARKQVTDERYLNIKIIRFYITCPGCNNTITFKTNPAEAGYTPEEGAVRNYERKPKKKHDAEEEDPYRDQDKNDGLNNREVKRKHEGETDEEILKRLEAEEKADRDYQNLLKRRKNNPFWTENSGGADGDVMEKFEKRLVEQHKEQQLNEELEAIQRQVDARKERGGDDALVDLVTKKFESRQVSEVGNIKKSGMETEIQKEENREDKSDLAVPIQTKTKDEKGPGLSKLLSKTEDLGPKIGPLMNIPTKILIKKRPQQVSLQIPSSTTTTANATTTTIPPLSKSLVEYSSDSD